MIFPIVAFFLTPVLYVIFFTINADIFSFLGVNSDHMLYVVGFSSVLLWLWSLVWSRSMNKFLRKRDKGNFKVVFAINNSATALVVFLYLFSSWIITPSLESNFYSKAFFFIALFWLVVFLLENFLRIYLTSKMLDVSRGDAIRSAKFLLFWEILVYGVSIAFFLYAAFKMYI